MLEVSNSEHGVICTMKHTRVGTNDSLSSTLLTFAPLILTPYLKIELWALVTLSLSVWSLIRVLFDWVSMSAGDPMSVISVFATKQWGQGHFPRNLILYMRAKFWNRLSRIEEINGRNMLTFQDNQLNMWRSKEKHSTGFHQRTWLWCHSCKHPWVDHQGVVSRWCASTHACGECTYRLMMTGHGACCIYLGSHVEAIGES